MPLLDGAKALLEEVAKLAAAHGVAGAIGGAGGYGLRAYQGYRKSRRITSAIREFFGLHGSHVVIIHSAVLDATRQAYNFPSCDTRAARAVAHLLESAGLTEGSHFSIVSEEEFSSRIGQLKDAGDYDLVFICGPKRNNLVAELLGMSGHLRYQLSRSPQTGENLLFDRERNSSFVSSRDNAGSPGEQKGGYDFGLLLSMPNPLNADRRAVVLAGIHGTGTLAAAAYITDVNQLAALCERRHGGIIQEVVRAEYMSNPEDVRKVVLV